MKVGQEIFIKTQGNAARFSGTQIIETKISKIGRKYFEVEHFHNRKFYIENMKEKTNYSVDYVAYFNKQDITDDIEKKRLESEIREKFVGYGKTKYTLDQLKAIKRILDCKIDMYCNTCANHNYNSETDKHTCSACSDKEIGDAINSRNCFAWKEF